MRSFGQEFYPYEAIRALKLAEKATVSDRQALRDRIATLLPQDSERTRRRIASKFVQRYFTGTRRHIAPPPTEQPFVRLVARHRHVPAQIELLYYQLAKIDTIVGAIARDLFYPVFILGTPPAGCSAEEFATLNGGQLLSVAPLLTRAFIVHYAELHWHFHNRATIDRSLRVLQGAGLIDRERMPELRRHPDAYRLSGHDVSLVTFVYALYDELLPQALEANMRLREDDITDAAFARVLLLSPSQINEHLDAARRHQLLARHESHIRFVFGDLNVLANALLTKAL
jgi:hypothetical protein